MQKEFEIIGEILPHIERWTRKIASIEEHMYTDQCALLIHFLKDLMKPLKALKETAGGSALSTLPLDNALDCWNEAFLYLVSYRPLCESTTVSD